jgi:molecular chaperone GrpE
MAESETMNSTDPMQPTDADVNETEGVETEADPLAKLQAELEQLRGENLKLLAETRNIQQRSRRELEERLRYAAAEIAKDMLPALDDLGRIIEAIEKTGDTTDVLTGLKLLKDTFLKGLRAQQIEVIPAIGQAFDPHVHEALLYQPSDEPAGTVIQEIATGYQLNDRVIRPTRVVVSSGPAKS